MNRTLLKNTLRTVNRSRGRFLAIFGIIAIGSGFYSGVKVTAPDMKLTADHYYKDTHLADLRVNSTIGFSESEIEALRARDGIRGLYAGYSAECFIPYDEAATDIVKVYSADFTSVAEKSDDAVNIPVLREGRYPEQANECLIEISTPGGYQIGDTITLLPGSKDAPLSDTFSEDTFTVVGVADYSLYGSFERGTASIGNGVVGSFMLVHEDAFCLEVKTDVFLTLEDTRGLDAFDDEYDAVVTAYADLLSEEAKDIYTLRIDEIRADAAEEIADAQQQIDDGEEEYLNGKQEFETEIKKAEEELKDAEQQIADGKEELAQGRQEYEDGMQAYTDAEAKLKEQAALLTSQKEELSASQEALTSAQKLGKTLQSAVSSFQYACALPPYDDTTTQLISSSAVLDSNAFKFSDTFAAYISAPVGSEEKTRYYNILWAAVGNYTTELESQQTALDIAAAQLAAGERELSAAQQKLEQTAVTLQNAALALEENEILLADSERELEEGRQTLEQERADGEQALLDARKELDEAIASLNDARRELDELEDSVSWYVLDRSYNPGYDNFEEDAERVDSIAAVFPIFFILVAALVCLTTMTRMVEEQRTELGTLKALGYSRVTIMLQYILYSAAASILGVTVGMLICTNVFPRAIFTAYKLMYNYPDVECPWRWDYFFGCLGVSLLCTGVSALCACGRELLSVPAQLMRPRPPKNGKRVALERVGFIWNRLSFNAKITVRNLSRYKSRVMMTIIGVAGCTALMLTGFGLRNGIAVIGDIQYEELFLYDVITVFDSEADEAERNAYTDAFADDALISDSLNLVQKTVTLYGNDANSTAVVFAPEDVDMLPVMVQLRERESKAPLTLSADGVILTEKLAKLLNLSVGDTVGFEGSDARLTVTGITEQYLSHYIYITPEQYEIVFGEYIPNTCIGKMTDPSQEDAFSERMLEHDCALLVSYTAGAGDTFHDLVVSMNMIVVLVIVSSGALAFVVLYNLANINITERMRELATIKVLGFFDGEVAAYVYRENTVSSLLGTAAGLVLGIFLNSFVLSHAEVDAVMFYPEPPLYAFVLAALLTIGFTVMVNWLLYFKLRNIDMAGSMKAIE